MGKRRNTAKTGDSKIYKGRVSGRDQEPSSKAGLDIDGLETNNMIAGDEGVEFPSHTLDLGDGSDDSSTSDRSSERDDDQSVEESASVQTESTDDESTHDEAEDEVDLREWGKTKSALYGGDTADIELTEDKTDAFVEESAAREVQTSRFNEMSKSDFEIFEYDDAIPEPASKTREPRKNHDDRLNTVGKLHTDMVALLSHLGGVVHELDSSTIPAKETLWSSALGSDAIGATKQGLHYVLTKLLLELSTALNANLSILLQSSADASIGNNDHPVVLSLKKCLTLINDLNSFVTSKAENIVQQLRDVAKAGDLLLTENGTSTLDVDDISAREEDEDFKETEMRSETPRSSTVISEETMRSDLVDARFSLRNDELNQVSPKLSVTRHNTEFGDMDIDRDATNALARTVNSIEQRSLSRKPNKRKTDEEPDSNFERLSDYLHEDEMLLESQIDSQSAAQTDSQNATDKMETSGDTFYENVKRKKQTKKSIRQAMYQVLPKFPSEDAEVEGERGITKAILKNRGLVAHKPKINRNPRVKKREQYRKAVIRRKGATRTVRNEAEKHQYDGEKTGIKSRVSHSRKLVS